MGARKPVELHTGHRTKEELEVLNKENEMATASRSCFSGSPPKELIDDYARKEWRRIIKVLEPMAIVGDLDRYALVGYCNCCSYSKKVNDKITEEGLWTDTENGPVVNTSLFNLLDKIEKQKRDYARQAGLSIDARLKLASLKLKQDSETEDDPYSEI